MLKEEGTVRGHLGYDVWCRAIRDAEAPQDPCGRDGNCERTETRWELLKVEI